MFDIGLNLANSQFKKDRDEVVKRAFSSGINGLLLIGTNLYESEQSVHLTKKYINCWSTVGVHPHDSKNWNEKSAEIIYTLAQSSTVIAIGECGLDFKRNFSTSSEQEYAFINQLKLAAELEIPVFLHCREAYERFIFLIKPWVDKIPGMVWHCFTGSKEQAFNCLNYGMYLGITGWLCDKQRGSSLRKLLPTIPIDRLLFETDSPYLFPRDIFSNVSLYRNEPIYLEYIIKYAAHCRCESWRWLEKKSDENVCRLFNIKF